jgi:hypothetical protein
LSDGIRVQLKHAENKETCLGWAYPAEASETDPAGFVVSWDDGWKDDANVRWQFDGNGIFDLEEVV